MLKVCKIKKILLSLTLLLFLFSILKFCFFEDNQYNFTSPPPTLEGKTDESLASKSNLSLSSQPKVHYEKLNSKYMLLLEREMEDSEDNDFFVIREANELFFSRLEKSLSQWLDEEEVYNLLSEYILLKLESAKSGKELYSSYREAQREFYQRIMPSNLNENDKRNEEKKMWRLWKRQYKHSVEFRKGTIEFWGDFFPLYERVKEEVNADVLETYPNTNTLHIIF